MDYGEQNNAGKTLADNQTSWQDFMKRINADEKAYQKKYSEIFIYRDEVLKTISEINRTGRGCSVLRIRESLLKYNTFSSDHVLALLEDMEKHGEVKRISGSYADYEAARHDLTDGRAQNTMSGLSNPVEGKDNQSFCVTEKADKVQEIVDLRAQLQKEKKFLEDDKNALKKADVKHDIPDILDHHKVLAVLEKDLVKEAKQKFQIGKAQRKVDTDNQTIERLNDRINNLLSQIK